jgi:hypothetical protein
VQRADAQVADPRAFARQLAFIEILDLIVLGGREVEEAAPADGAPPFWT